MTMIGCQCTQEHKKGVPHIGEANQCTAEAVVQCAMCKQKLCFDCATTHPHWRFVPQLDKDGNAVNPIAPRPVLASEVEHRDG